MLRLDLNLVWNIINLIVLYLLLNHFLIKPVTEIMNKRQAMIEQNITAARDLEMKAAELKLQYETKLQASAEEGSKIIADARENAKMQHNRMVADADGQANRIIENAHKTAKSNQEKAMQDVKVQIAGLVMAAAAKIINSENDDLKNQEIYDKYIAEAGELHDAGGR